MNLYQDLPKPFFVLAPMDDVTDTVFRQVVAGCTAPAFCMTEFVNVDGLQSPGRQKLLKKLKFTAHEPPLVAQIWGKDPENFYKTAQQVADGTFARELGLPEGVNYAGVDLNMGCPQKNEVKSGTCCALINDRPLAKEIITATREGLAGRLPLSVKTRVGYHEVDMTWFEFLLSHDLQALTVHGRTKREMSKVPANWDLIGEVRELRDKFSPQTKIIGNGDVLSRQQGLELAEKYQLDGIMIGRGIFHDPYAFAEESPWANFTEQQRRTLYKKHIELFAATWQNRERPLQTLNKFCKVYIQNFEGASRLRDQLMHTTTTTDLLNLLVKD